MNYILLISVIVILLLECILLDFDLLNPAVMITIGWFFSSFVITIWSMFWPIKLYTNTIIFVLTSIIISFMVSCLCKVHNTDRAYSCVIENMEDYFYISNSRTMIIIIFCIIVDIMYFSQMKSVASSISGELDDFSSILSAYRTVTFFSGQIKGGAAIGFFVSQLYKIVIAFGYISLFLFCKNVALGDSWLNNINFVFVMITYLISSSLLTSRSHYINYLLSALLFMCICSGTNIKEWISNNRKAFLRILLLLIIMFFGFYTIRNLFGRNNNNSFLIYIANYISGPLYGFNEFVHEYPRSRTGLNETFPAIQRLLMKLGENDTAQSAQISFFYIMPGVKNNVYTALRRWLNDFGIGGMYILQIMFSFFFCGLYRHCLIRKKDVTIVLFAYMYIATWSHFFDDLFFKTFVSVSAIIQLIIIWACYIWITRIRFVVNH